MVVDPEHTQGLKKTKQNFTLANKSHSNHIHKKKCKVSKRTNYRALLFIGFTMNKVWIQITLIIKFHFQQCLMPQFLRANSLLC